MIHSSDMKLFDRIVRNSIFPFIFLTCLVFLAYGNSLGNGFVSDDRWILTMLPNTLPTILRHNPTIHLINVFWWGAYQVFQFTPWSYRLINIFAHLGSTLLLYVIMHRLSNRRTAFLSASLFAVHPMFVESVSWIAGGVYATSGCLFLLSFYLYIRADQELKSKNHSGVRIASYVVFLFTVLFSEKAVPLFLLYGVYEISRGNLRSHIKRLIPFILFACGFLTYYLFLLPGRLTGVAEVVGRTVQYNNPLIQIPTAFSMYFQLFVWPDRLSFYQSETMFGLTSFTIRVIVTIGFFLGWIWSFFRARKTYFLWFSWFVIPLLPTLTPLQIAWVVAERYVYISLIGLIVLFSLVLDALMTKKRLKIPLMILFILILIALTVRTVFRNRDWQSEDTLWIATVRTAPSNQFTWNNMGDYYSRHGDLPNAATSFRRAIALAPGYAPAYYNLAGTLLQMGETGDAILLFQKALLLKPDFWEVHRALASIYIEKGEYDNAMKELDAGRTLYPTDPVMNQNYALIRQILSERNTGLK